MTMAVWWCPGCETPSNSVAWSARVLPSDSVQEVCPSCGSEDFYELVPAANQCWPSPNGGTFSVHPKSVRAARAYMPDNFTVDDDGRIRGVDRAGWTMRGYVIPRLASGMIPVRLETECGDPIAVMADGIIRHYMQ